MQTPPDIHPLWFFTPYYAILRSFPNKQFGVASLALSVLILFGLPWIDCHPVRSIRYRSWAYKAAVVLFAFTFITLGFIGEAPATLFWQRMGSGVALVYFLFFVVAWTYARRPTPRRLLLTLAAVLAVVGFLIWRFYLPSIAGLIWRTSLVPIVYALLFLLVPVFVPGLLRDRPVPDRVRMR